MVQAGSVEALLTLNVSGFNTGISTAVKNIETLTKTLNSIATNSKGFVSGLNQVTESMTMLNDAFAQFDVSSKKAQAFNNIANGMERLVNSARALAEGNTSLEATYQHMQNVVNMFAQALSNAEIQLNGTLNVTRQTSSVMNEAAQGVNRYSQALQNPAPRTFATNIEGIFAVLGSTSGSLTNATASVREFSLAMSSTSGSTTNATTSIRDLSLAMNTTKQSILTMDTALLTFRNGMGSLRAVITETASMLRYLEASMQGFGVAITPNLNTTSSAISNLTHNMTEIAPTMNTTTSSMNNMTTGLNNIQLHTKGADGSIKSFNQTTTTSSTSVKSLKGGFDTASNGARNLKSNVGGLTQSLSMLRGVVGMVASMFLFNFAHGMMISVQNTVKAKSEMLSFLNTMGLTQNQIAGFNQALDQTADRFQRINKYNIGETVANIGLEFDLSAEEMKKAMSVTSMVTSEYLRAGRNADEAALAVKDIMQGQFQRLSRETGVKGSDLEKAGWSGDVNDVMGLMDALEKVAKGRHWDVFAEKASSLNDILLITQNRFSEWATDMSEGITPIITESFNLMIAGIDRVTSLFGRLGEALHIPDWVGTAVMIGGFATGLMALVTSTIRARTGLGLLDIAHKGLGQSIVATIFNIKSEEMANQKATTIAMGKVLGLNAEAVAERGLSGAIAQSITQQQISNLQREQGMRAIVGETTSIAGLITTREAEVFAEEHGISVKQAKLLLQQEENLQNMSTITLLAAKTLGLNMTTLAEKGFLIALAERIALSPIYQAFLSEETIANMGLATAIGITASAMLPLIAVIGVLAVSLGSLAMETMHSAETMKQFNELVSDGDNIIKDAKSTVDSYSKKVEELKDRLHNAKEGSAEYLQIQQELRVANANLTVATNNYEDAIKSVEMARSRQSKFEQQMNDLTVDGQRQIIEALKDTKLGWAGAEEAASNYYSTVAEGVNTLNNIAGFKAYDNTRTAQGVGVIAEEFKDDPEELERRANKYIDVHKRLQENFKKMNSETSFTGRLDAWLGFEANQVEIWLQDFQNAWDSGDWASVGKHIEDTLKAVIIPFNINSMINDAINGLSGNEWVQGIQKWLDDANKSITDGLNWFNGLDFGKMFSDAFPPLEGILNDWLGNTDEFITNALNWFNNLNFGQIVADWWNSIDWSALSVTGGLLNMIFGLTEGVDIQTMLNEKFAGVQEFFSGFVSNISNTVMVLPSVLWGHLSQVIALLPEWGGQLLSQGVAGGNNLVNGVVSVVSQLPSKVYTFLLNVVSSIISGASSWSPTASNKATELVNAVTNIVAQLPDKVANEFMKIPQRIVSSISSAVQAATQFGTSVVNAVLNALHIHSPGIIQEKIATEFADVGGRIAESGTIAQTEASNFGQRIVQGMDSQMTNVVASATALTNAMNQTQPDVVLDQSFVGDYQADANTISGINQTMTSDTTMAFDMMGSSVNASINGITANVQSSYTAMNTNQTTALATMQNQNKTAYTNLQNQTSSSLNNMRNTTQNVTVQMIGAWNHMKDSIISSADQLKSQSTAHFNTLSNNIGSFYQKLQNPSMWGGSPDGYKMSAHHYSPHRGLRGANEVRRAFGVPTSGTGRFAGGPSSLNQVPDKMKLKDLKNLVGGSPIFNGLDLNQEVDVAEFLRANGVALGWGDWHDPHFNEIKTTSGEWDMQGPMIMHRIPTGQSFKVKEFYNSRPQISFSSFQSMAEALFSAIPYEYYFNSDAHGSWVGALQAGSCNCYDGANALVALAATCGFSGHTQGGTWNGIPHVYAVINGKKMDTTGWQQRRDWNGVAAGSPSNMKGFGENKTVNINIDMTNSTFYGEDDFKERMETIAHDVLRKEVNTSITVGY